MWFPFCRNHDFLKNGTLISICRTGDGFHSGLFTIYLPHLFRMIPCSYWALTCCAALPSCKTLYVISVRQTRDLPVVSLFPHPASFRFHLTMDTLAFGYILPTTRRIRDLHPLETCAAGRTQKKDLKKAELFVKSRLLQILFIIISVNVSLIC